MDTQDSLPLEAAPETPKEKPTKIEGSAPDCQLKRPKRHDERIVQAAAERLALKCLLWDGSVTAEEWVEDLVKGKHHWRNGYELAKYLDDRCHLEPDSELVDILDYADSYLDDAHKEEVKRWVGIVGFTPAHQVGEIVNTFHGKGPVHTIYVETAQYVVDTKGHGKGGYIIDAEDLMPMD